MKNKNDWKTWKKQIDAITNQNKRIEVLTKKNDHKSIYKEVFDKLVKERFDKIIELNNEINQNDLVYYLKDNARRRFDDFNNGIKLFWKNKIWWNETWKT